MNEAFGLPLQGGGLPDGVVVAVVVAEVIGNDGSRSLHLCSTDMPEWTQLRYLHAGVLAAQDETSKSWIDDEDDA